MSNTFINGRNKFTQYQTNTPSIGQESTQSTARELVSLGPWKMQKYRTSSSNKELILEFMSLEDTEQLVDYGLHYLTPCLIKELSASGIIFSILVTNIVLDLT